MKNNFIKIFNKNKKIIISLILFIFVFAILGLPYTNWWFNGDDFHGIFLGYKTKTLKDIFNFFLDGHTNQYIGPTNSSQYIKPNFLEAYYRPLYCVYLTIQYKLFGTTAYYYLLTNVFFHALNTVILFNIFLFFINILPAALISCLFAFHPQIAYRFGAIVNLHYYINIFLILLLFLFFKKYLDTKKIPFYILASICFILSLLTRETSIVLPLIITIGSYLYCNLNKTNQTNFIKNIFEQIKITANFWIILIIFFIFRISIYSIKFTQTKIIQINLSAIKTFITNKMPQLQNFFYDSLGVSWLAWGEKRLKIFFVITLTTLFCYLFIKNKQQKYIFYFLFCSILMLWPGIISTYSPRYFYEISPFVLIAFILLFKYSDSKILKLKKTGLILLSLTVLFYVNFCSQCFLLREKKMEILSKGVNELIKNSEIKNKALCFFSYPVDGFGDNCATIFWILLNNLNQIIYCDSRTVINTGAFTQVGIKNLPAEYPEINLVTIKKIKSGFNFQTLNTNKFNFVYPLTGYSVGQIFINKLENNKIITDFDLIIKKEYLDKNPIFIKWDFALKKFLII